MLRRLALACLAVACTACLATPPSSSKLEKATGRAANSIATTTTTPAAAGPVNSTATTTSTTSTSTSTSTTSTSTTSTTSTSTTSTSTTSTTTALGGLGNCVSEPTSTFTRPYADHAPWNVPVCHLDADSRSADWAQRFYLYSRQNSKMGTAHPETEANLDDHGIMFGLDTDPVNDFSVTVFDSTDATTTVRVFQRQGWAGYWSVDNGSSIPWNPSWKASWGSDSLMIIRDVATGTMWSLWGLAQNQGTLPVNDSECWSWSFAFWIYGGGFRPGVDLCVGGVDRNRTADRSALTDYRTYAGNNPHTRGAGIDEYAMLVTPDEVASGAIRHAMMMPVYNTMNGGVTCNATQFATTAFGNTCGEAMAPAGNFERDGRSTNGCNEPVAAAMTTDAWRATSIPEGIRYALHMTDAEIETWLNQRGFTGTKRQTAKTFVVALVNYGWFITDTSCYGADFQVAGGANPATAAQWRSLGINDDGRNLLYDLFTPDRIWTVEQPWNQCTDGVERRSSCPAMTSVYK